jgi:Sec-independent protein translocase protein TatA
MWEVVLILVVALVVLGPSQLMETAKVLGKLYRELQKMVMDVRNTVDIDSLTSTTPPAPQPSPPHYEPPKGFTRQDLVAPPGEKTGPDFYAELLAKAAEEDKLEKAGEEEKSEGDADKEAAVEQAAPDGAASRGGEKGSGDELTGAGNKKEQVTV